MPEPCIYRDVLQLVFGKEFKCGYCLCESAWDHGDGIGDYGDEGVAEYVLMNMKHRKTSRGGWISAAFGRKFRDFRCKCRAVRTWGKRAGGCKSVRCNGSPDQLLQPDEKAGTGSGRGYRYCELSELLKESDVICSCLSKNVTLLYEEEFEALGENTILFNTALSPCFRAACD